MLNLDDQLEKKGGERVTCSVCKSLLGNKMLIIGLGNKAERDPDPEVVHWQIQNRSIGLEGN